MPKYNYLARKESHNFKGDLLVLVTEFGGATVKNRYVFDT